MTRYMCCRDRMATRHERWWRNQGSSSFQRRWKRWRRGLRHCSFVDEKRYCSSGETTASTYISRLVEHQSRWIRDLTRGRTKAATLTSDGRPKSRQMRLWEAYKIGRESSNSWLWWGRWGSQYPSDGQQTSSGFWHWRVSCSPLASLEKDGVGLRKKAWAERRAAEASLRIGNLPFRDA